MNKTLLLIGTFVLMVVGVLVIVLGLPGPSATVLNITVTRLADKQVTVVNVDAAKLIGLVMVLVAAPLFVRAISLDSRRKDGARREA